MFQGHLLIGCSCACWFVPRAAVFPFRSLLATHLQAVYFPPFTSWALPCGSSVTQRQFYWVPQSPSVPPTTCTLCLGNASRFVCCLVSCRSLPAALAFPLISVFSESTGLRPGPALPLTWRDFPTPMALLQR